MSKPSGSIKKRKTGTSAYTPTENKSAGVAIKVELRKRCLEFVGGHASARVFDAFAGNGAMYRATWKGSADYVGCEVREEVYDPERAIYLGDCQRVLRAIDASPFNVFDLDDYGAPWSVAYVLAHVRKLAPGERCAVAFTDGAALNAHFGSIDKVFLHMAGATADVAKGNWNRLTVTAITKMAHLMGADVAWCDVRDSQRMACYSAAGLIGRGLTQAVREAIAAEPT